jgi:hypothetical protein
MFPASVVTKSNGFIINPDLSLSTALSARNSCRLAWWRYRPKV